MTARQVVEKHVDAPSADIAARLEATGALVCEHGRNPCAMFCGVERDVVGVWVVIPLEDRLRRADRIDRVRVTDG